MTIQKSMYVTAAMTAKIAKSLAHTDAMVVVFVFCRGRSLFVFRTHHRGEGSMEPIWDWRVILSAVKHRARFIRSL